MSDFFKQLIAQLAAVWQRLSLQQRIIIVSLVALTVLGLVGLMLYSAKAPAMSGYKVLYSDLAMEEASQITQKLQEGKYEYKLENEGKTILVNAKNVYEIRMALARDGLPKSHGVGYELFDKTNLGMTDFVQKINARRALEGELQRSIEGLEEVKQARVHIVIPEKTIFLDEKEDAKASVVVQMKSGSELSKEQIRGISYLVSSSVDGLKSENISIVDANGRLLSSPYGEDPAALASSRNLELQQNVEKYYEGKAKQILEGVLGPGKATIKVAVDLDFDQVERNLESFDPESRVVRSEERQDENTKNAPDGDRTKERSLTNYEIDKKVEHIVQEVGNVKRLTVSVAVDGKYETGADGKRTYTPREAQFVQSLEEMIKNTLGYDVARGDQITVANVQFDNEFLRSERDSMDKQERLEMYFRIGKYIVAVLIIVALVIFLMRVAKIIAEAMNPPVPEVASLVPEEEIPQEVPANVRRTSEILDRVEMLTREEPVNIASIIRQWLTEPAAQQKK